MQVRKRLRQNMIKSTEKMKKHRFIIRGRLPGLNTFISQAKSRSGMYIANREKQSVEKIIILSAIQKIKERPIKKPVMIQYHWVEPNRKRDLDNIAFAKKFINDALVKANILQNDGWRDIVAISDTFAVDKDNPRVEVTITEIDKNIMQ